MKRVGISVETIVEADKNTVAGRTVRSPFETDSYRAKNIAGEANKTVGGENKIVAGAEQKTLSCRTAMLYLAGYSVVMAQQIAVEAVDSTLAVGRRSYP